MQYINPYKLFVGSFIPAWLEPRREISPGCKLTFARLCRYAGKNGKCFPSEATIAEALGVSTRTIKRHIAELVKYNLIEAKFDGVKGVNSYKFLWHKWMEGSVEIYITPGDKVSERRDTQGDKNGTSVGTQMSPGRESLREGTKEDTVVDGKSVMNYQRILAQHPFVSFPSYQEIKADYQEFMKQNPESKIILPGYVKVRMGNVVEMQKKGVVNS